MAHLLDAAFPPADVQKWIAALRSAGASGCLAYVYDTQVTPNLWTPAYCRAIQDAGFGILPVYVFGPAYPVIGHARQVMAAYGWHSGPVMGDLEGGSMPGTTYFRLWCQDLRAHGFQSVAYGVQATLDTYRPAADAGFLANYIQRSLNPIPALPAALDGWQYANSFTFAGIDVDASACSIPLITGAPTTGDDTMKVVVGNPATYPAGYADPHGKGAAYITDGVLKRWIPAPAELGSLYALSGQSAPLYIDQATLDRMPEVTNVGNPGSGDLDFGQLQQAAAQILKGTPLPATDLAPVLAAIAALDAKVTVVAAKVSKDLA
ncbi:MAG TPA: hypothetical protein VMV23_01520 [Candidatus Nanopelagicaceae bacterium]|nr:hypothetical protein [Candidatus Nanopelagicaceae bacterium]